MTVINPFALAFRRLSKKQEPEVLQCPKCKSKDIIAIGMIIGYGYINPETMEVDEPLDEWEAYSDLNELRFECRDCEHEWEL